MVEVEVGCARGCEREVFDDMWVAIGVGTVTILRSTQRSTGGEKEKMGRKEERMGPVTVINWDPHEFSSNLNPDWIKKQAKG